MRDLVATLQDRFPFEMSFRDFRSWCNSNPSALAPVIILQLKLRRKILGERYWARYTEMRKNSAEKISIIFVQKLKKELLALRHSGAKSKFKI
jgi:hypothetical protein